MRESTHRRLHLLKLAWPLIVSNSFWNLQLTIDRIFLGAYSTEALGAAMAVMGVFWVPMALLQQTSAYVSAFVAQYIGANEDKKVGQALWHSFWVAVLGGLLFMLLNFVSAPFFAAVGHSPDMQRLEVEYWNSVSWSALPTALVAAASGFYTGVGRTKPILVINFTGLVLNVVLDYIMIFGKFGFPALGVAGAGYATALATWGSALVGLWMIAQSDLAKRFDFKFKMKLDPTLLKQFLKFGIPSGLQWALEGLAFTVFLIIMGRTAMGDAALSSSSIAVTVMMLTVLPSMGMAQAVLSQVGQALGSKNAEAAKLVTKDGIYLTLIYILIVASTFYLIPEFFLSWFKNDSNPALWNQVAQLTTQLLKIVAIFTILDSVYLNISFALKGAGDTRFVSIVALLVPWPIMVLPAYLLRNHSDAVTLAWWFAALYSLTITAILSYRFIKGRWTQIDMIHSP